MGRPRLSIELVPKGAFGDNLRSSLPDDAWDKIRQYVCERANQRCEICGGQGDDHPVECHEVWDYDAKNKVQKLSALQALCPSCHKAKHIGRTQVEEDEEYERIMDHLCEVNGWSRGKASEYKVKHFKAWVKQSKSNWKQEYPLLEEEPFDTLLEDFDLDF